MIRLAVTLAALALISAQTATASPVRSPELETRLSLHYEVYVTDTDNSWVQIGEPRIYLSAWAARLLLHGNPDTIDPQTQMPWAMAIHTLLHEYWHLAFREYNEQNADLGALAIMREQLRSHWGLSAKEAQHQYEFVAGVNGVARSHYRPFYTPTLVDPLLGI